MAGTNIIVDGSTEFALLQTVLAEIQKMVEKHKDSDPEKALMAQLATYLNKHGANHAMYKLVPKNYEKQFREALTTAKMPHAVLHDDRGNALFVVRDKDQEKFLQIQSDIFSLSTDYYAQCTVEKLCEIAQHKEQSQLIRLNVKSEGDLQELQDRLYQEGRGIVSAVCAKKEDKDGKDVYSIVIDAESAYKANGNDLSRMALEWAFDEASTDHMELRTAQAEYDMKELYLALNEVRRGHTVAMVDERGESKYHVTISPKKATFYRENKQGIWEMEREEPTPVLDPADEKYDPKKAGAFQAALQTSCARTKNQRAILITDLHTYINGDWNTLKKLAESHPSKRREKKEPQPGERVIEERPEEKESYFSPEMELEKLANRPSRPTAEAWGISESENYRKKGQVMIQAIDQHARDLAQNTPGFENLSAIQKMHMIQNNMKLIIASSRKAMEEKGYTPQLFEEDVLPEVVDFVLEGEQSQEAFQRFASAFLDSEKDKEKEEHDLDIEICSVQEIEREERSDNRYEEKFRSLEPKRAEEKDQEQEEEMEEEEENSRSLR